MPKMNVKKGGQVVVLSGKGKKVRICKKCGAEF